MSHIEDFKRVYDEHAKELEIPGMELHPDVLAWLDPIPQAILMRRLIDRVEQLEQHSHGVDLFRAR